MFASRGKGSVAEREVAKLLETWWKQVEPESRFVKTPLSGGWSSAEVRVGFHASGDLMTTAERFPFVVEVKRREGWSPVNLVTGRRCPVWEWWRQTQREAAEATAEPLLWVRRNAEPAKGSKTGGTLPPVWLVMCRAVLVRARRLPFPDLVWSPSGFSPGVDYGAELPVGYMSWRFLAIDPLTFASEPQVKRLLVG